MSGTTRAYVFLALIFTTGLSATANAQDEHCDSAFQNCRTPLIQLIRSEQVGIDVAQRFADAWNRHDLDALMSMMTDDCVFEASAGPRFDGQRSEGKQAVRAAYAAVFEAFHDAHWANLRHFIAGDRGVSEWTFTGTQKDGKRVEVTGCDLFTFRDGTIAIKNSYRKNRPAI